MIIHEVLLLILLHKFYPSCR